MWQQPHIGMEWQHKKYDNKNLIPKFKSLFYFDRQIR